jgi:uncharacterized damage-inducible protein DinB
MIETIQSQYREVLGARAVLFAYCASISNAHFIAENSSIGRGSIRNLLAHIASTYQYWLGAQAMGRDIAFAPYHTFRNMDDIEKLFTDVDLLVAEYFDFLRRRGTHDFILELEKANVQAAPLKLFTHVITHEFHHKGQILSLSRHLGYTPVDTDVMR